MKDNQENDLISSEDVLAVVSGNQDALAEQLERAKEVAIAQLNSNHSALTEEDKKKAEEAKKQQELANLKNEVAKKSEQLAYQREEQER